MKKEYICYYFDKCFKGKVNEDDFMCAKDSLFCLLILEETDARKKVIKDFTQKYFKMHHDIEKDLEIIEGVVFNTEYFESLNFFKKLGYKRELKNLRETYSNFGKFNSDFFNAFEVSLVKVKDEIDATEELNLKT